MKRVLIYTAGLVLCMLLLGVMPISGEEEIYDNVIRLHILANSDSEADQADKLAVRNAILAEYRTVLIAASTEEATKRVETLLPEIEKTAQKTLADRGNAAEVAVTFTEETYPERIYEGLHFPAGRYRSLRVLIGEGEGKNWWCVLFPPLCVGAATEEIAVTQPVEPPPGLGESSWRLVSQSGENEIRFKLLEWLMGN